MAERVNIQLRDGAIVKQSVVFLRAFPHLRDPDLLHYTVELVAEINIRRKDGPQTLIFMNPGAKVGNLDEGPGSGVHQEGMIRKLQGGYQDYLIAGDITVPRAFGN